MHNRPQKPHRLSSIIDSILLVYCGLVFAAMPIYATHAQIDDIAASLSESLEATTTTISEPLEVNTPITSEQRFDFNDIYTINLELSLAGSVEVNAAHGDEIIVRLEKRGRGADEDSVRKYFGGVELSASKTDNVLMLVPRLPTATDSKAELTRLDCFVESPPDVSLKIRTQNGDIRVNRIRGDIELKAAIGEIRLNETMGGYQVYSGEGDIDCEIFLTNRANQFETVSGEINLVVLDEISAPTNITATGGGITLRLPNSFQAEVEIQTKNRDPRAVSINMPIEVESSFEGDALHGWINGGGPLFQLTADDEIAIVSLKATPSDDETSAESANSQDEINGAQLVPKAPESPAIDGNLFEYAWSKAVALHPFYKADGSEEADEPTQAFLMWDEQRLYIGIKVYGDEMGQLHVSQTKTGSTVWHDDSIEILVDPNPETQLYYHLIVNPIGAIFSQMVRTDYPPNFRFAPTVTEPKDNRKHISKAKSSRNSEVKQNQNQKDHTPYLDAAQVEIETQITSRYWSIEIALMRDFLETELTGNWLLNLHRRTQKKREFSYWMPTYDTETPWWPHYRDRMGRLQFTTANDESALFGIEEQLAIGEIEIKGNSTIPTPEIVQQIPFEIGEVITSSQLSWLVEELGEHPWFRKARLDTVMLDAHNGESDVNLPETDGDSSVEPPQPVPDVDVTMNVHNISPPLRLALRIHITEFPTLTLEKFDIEGNKHFKSGMLREWFGLNRGRTSIEALNAKSQLIAKLYRNHGYELARIEEKFTSHGLELTIDEGRLDAIRFTGNKRIKYHELTQMLKLREGDIHNRLQTQKQISRMREKLIKHNAIFKDVRDWQAQREKGKKVLFINIEEHPPIQYYALPRVGFNRVHGLILGGSGKVSTEAYVKGQIFGGASIGLSSSIENYRLGAEKQWFGAHELRLGGTWYKLTGVVHSPSTYVEEGILSSAIFGTSLVDFYQRQGYQTWLAQMLTASSQIALSFTDEQHERLFTVTDWSLVSRGLPKRGNARIDEGKARSFKFSYHYDTRDFKFNIKRPFMSIPWPSEHTTRGWRSSFSVEYSSHRFNSDFDFTLYRFEIARYNRLTNGHNLDFRVMGGLSDSPLPRQRLFYANLNNILRGFGFNRFIGDNLLALNVEYKVARRLEHIGKGKSVNGAASIFLDAGDTWFHHERFSFTRANASVGIGFSLFTDAIPYGGVPDTLRFEIVRALQRRQVTNYILRLSRNF